MSASKLTSGANKTNSFDADTGSLPSTSDDFQPRVISERIFIIVTSVLAATLILTILIGCVHFIRRRHRRQPGHRQHGKNREQQDIEQSLQRARRPILTIDTDLSHAKDLTRPAIRATLPYLPGYSEVPSAPLVQVRTAPPSIYRSGMSAFGPVRFHSASRNSLNSHLPGVSGRNTIMPVHQGTTFQEMNFRECTQTHNPYDMGLDRYT